MTISQSSTVADRRRAIRAAALQKAELVVEDSLRVQRARGLQSQLRAAGWIPPEIAVDEADRRPQQWRDREGRRHVLRPYGTLQWQVSRQRLKHEIEAARADLAREAQARDAAFALWKQRETLRDLLDGLPQSAAQFRDQVLDRARVALAGIAWYATERWPGCRVAPQSRDELLATLAHVLRVLEAAEYRVDPSAAHEVRAQLHRLEARADEDFQTFLRRLGTACADDANPR